MTDYFMMTLKPSANMVPVLPLRRSYRWGGWPFALCLIPFSVIFLPVRNDCDRCEPPDRVALASSTQEGTCLLQALACPYFRMARMARMLFRAVLRNEKEQLGEKLFCAIAAPFADGLRGAL